MKTPRNELMRSNDERLRAEAGWTELIKNLRHD
jgi:hypothetical protein